MLIREAANTNSFGLTRSVRFILQVSVIFKAILEASFKQ